MANKKHGEPGSSKYQEFNISSWDEFRETVESNRFQNWGFRGQEDSKWELYTSLSRYLRGNVVHQDAWSLQEQRVLRIFKRKAHLFLDHVPSEEDAFQWLSIMQHHGAPTRLLDVTWSPYVALFSALERAQKEAAVWAFNAGEINEKEYQIVQGGRKIDLRKVSTWLDGSYEKYFLPNNRPFVLIGEPKIMNQRLIAQSGTFIVAGVLDKPIEQILADYENPGPLITKFVLDTKKVRERSMHALYHMNITNATLFPDINGLARSMAYELEFHWAFNPKTLQSYPGFPPLNKFTRGDLFEYLPNRNGPTRGKSNKPRRAAAARSSRRCLPRIGRIK